MRKHLLLVTIILGLIWGTPAIAADCAVICQPTGPHSAIVPENRICRRIRNFRSGD